MTVTAIHTAARWADGGVIVAAYAGTADGARALAPAVHAVRRALPKTQLVLLWPAALELPAVAARPADRVVLYPTPPDGARGEPARLERAVVRAVAALEAEAPAAAIVLTETGHAPFLPAYLCYLAGVPRRVALTAEFGGALLTQAVPPPPGNLPQRERHLFLLEAIGMGAPRGKARAAVRLPATAEGARP
ncbi:MAG TPA: hypothetical protein VF322_11385 [Gammaproteobacteria bacterium]